MSEPIKLAALAIRLNYGAVKGVCYGVNNEGAKTQDGHVGALW